MNPILSVKGISVQFGALKAVQDVSFEAQPGKITAVIGPNGAGKSSLFNLISGRFGTRGAGRNSWRGSASGRLGSTRGATPHFNQLEAQFRKHGAFGGEMFVLGVANGAVEISLHGAAPTR